MGIVSDNRPEDVGKVASLLGIWDYFNPRYTSIFPWEEPADKYMMIQFIKKGYGEFPEQNGNVVLVDAKEKYRIPLTHNGFAFIHSQEDSFPSAEILEFIKK